MHAQQPVLAQQSFYEMNYGSHEEQDPVCQLRTCWTTSDSAQRALPCRSERNRPRPQPRRRAWQAPTPAEASRGARRWQSRTPCHLRPPHCLLAVPLGTRLPTPFWLEFHGLGNSLVPYPGIAIDVFARSLAVCELARRRHTLECRMLGKYFL